MKSFKVLFLITMLVMSLAFTFSGGESLPTDDNEPSYAKTLDGSASEANEFNSLRGTNHFLAHLPIRAVMTCQSNPSVCLVEGSPGPDCCTNKCVNLATDESNCGRCGKKCGYRKMCCEGKCVNPMTNEQHCGKCGNKCDKGSSCVYGMCSYA